MKITIGDFQELTGKSNAKILRFSVTVLSDEGRPLWTSEGWRLFLEGDQKIYPPSLGQYGRASYNKCSPEFLDMLRQGLLKVEQVKELMEKYQIEPPNVIPGEIEL